MTNKIETPLALLKNIEMTWRQASGFSNKANDIIAEGLGQLRALLAAPAVERQEPVAYRIIYNDGEASGWMNGKPAELDVEDVATGVLRAIELAYTSPPAPVAVELPFLFPHYRQEVVAAIEAAGGTVKPFAQPKVCECPPGVRNITEGGHFPACTACHRRLK